MFKQMDGERPLAFAKLPKVLFYIVLVCQGPPSGGQRLDIDSAIDLVSASGRAVGAVVNPYQLSLVRNHYRRLAPLGRYWRSGHQPRRRIDLQYDAIQPQA